MQYLLYSAIPFGLIFAIGGIYTGLLWIKFFPKVKATDEALYEKIRFKLNSPFSKAYSKFIYGKGYQNCTHINIKEQAKTLETVGRVSQWGFNIYMSIIIVVLLWQWLLN